MARSASSKRSEARKKPSTSKLPRGTAAAKKTKSRKAAGRTGAKKSAVKGKGRKAATRSHKGAGKAPKRSPKVSTKRAGKAEAAKNVQAATGGESTGQETPGAHRSPRVEVRNVNVPGYRSTVDATKYEAMRGALMQALPSSPPGLTQNEMLEAVLPRLSEERFPGGEKAMWWIKTVQLDQEARGAIKRSGSKPLRWWRA